MSSATMQGPPHASPMAQSNPTLPQNTSQADISNAWANYKRMREQGVPPNDPEFLKVSNYLRAVKQQTSNQKERTKISQSQPQQQNGTPRIHGQQNDIQNGQQNGPQDAFSTDQSPPSHPKASLPSMPGASTALTEEQKTMLRNQMVAYRLLCKDAPIPPDIQNASFASLRSHQTSSMTPTTSSPHDHAREKMATPSDLEMAESPAASSRVYTSSANPHSYIKDRIGFVDHDKMRWSRQGNRILIPSIMPRGIDTERMRDERETIIFNRLSMRKTELERLPSNLQTLGTSKSGKLETSPRLKLKALIEYKKLCLLPKQRLLRQALTREVVQSDSLAMTANRALYRRQKKQRMHDARITERLEKDQRNARENKEKKKHSDFIESILAQSNSVRRGGIEQAERSRRFGRAALQAHQAIEKEEQKRVERTAKQRLAALKANDEETYLKLLGQAKDTRISHLLRQTDNFLNQLASSVKQQQRSANDQWANKAVQPDEPSSDEELEDDEEGGGKKVDYYEIAHRIKEDVTEQSTNLVGGKLKDYQLKGLQWMISLYNNNLNGILADEMGLGKTIQTISLVTYLIEKKRQSGPYLVIVPLSTLTNWNNEFEKWAPSVSKIVYKGPPTSRKAAQAQIRSGNFQVLLTTYEFIIKDRPLLSKIKWLHMIVDEGHRMKNANSKLSSTISQYYHTKYRLILTGTPLQNNLPELWSLLNFILPNIFKSVKSFDEWFNTPFANTGTQEKMDLTEEEQLLVIKRLHKVLRPFLLRRLKLDVEKDLPEKQERVIKCKFSSLQIKCYRQLREGQKLLISDGKGGRMPMKGLSNMIMQLRKLCNHPFVFDEIEHQINPLGATNDLIWRVSGKFELLDRILPKYQATGHRVLMFFQMTQIMNIAEDFMRLREIKYLRLDGGTKSDERADLLKEFNAPDSPYFIFLLSTRAGGLGLNLQTADTVIIFDSDWNPHQDLQAQDRAHRIGQKNEVRILRLISTGSIEEKILERANYKLDMDSKVIQAGKFDNKSTNAEREQLLRAMMEHAENDEDLDTEEMDDGDLNNLMIRNDGELEIFEAIDAKRRKEDPFGEGKKYPRLFSEAELPDVYLNESVQEISSMDEFTFGRGARERKRVAYDDGLTEEQWLAAVDDDEDTIEDAQKRNESRKARLAANKEKRTQNHGDDDDTPPVASRNPSSSPAPRKRGRKSGGSKRKASDAALDDESVAAASPAPAPPRKRGRQAKATETLSGSEREKLQQVLDKLFDVMDELKESTQDENGDNFDRPILPPFLDLPPKKSYPDYYQIIRDPICVSDIQKKINSKRYQGLDGFAEDVRLLCSNCRTYNEDGSPLWNDANLIETTIIPLLIEETKNNPALGIASYTGGTGKNEASTPVSERNSGVATPMEGVQHTGSVGGTKLKLSLTRNNDGADYDDED